MYGSINIIAILCINTLHFKCNLLRETSCIDKTERFIPTRQFNKWGVIFLFFRWRIEIDLWCSVLFILINFTFISISKIFCAWLKCSCWKYWHVRHHISIKAKSLKTYTQNYRPPNSRYTDFAVDLIYLEIVLDEVFGEMVLENRTHKFY